MCQWNFVFHPFWVEQAVNSPLWVELMFLTLSLRKYRNDIKERITTAAQNSPKSTKPVSFQKAAVIQSTATSGFATKSSPRKIMKWAGYVSLHNVLDHGLCQVIYELLTALILINPAVTDVIHLLQMYPIIPTDTLQWTLPKRTILSWFKHICSIKRKTFSVWELCFFYILFLIWLHLNDIINVTTLKGRFQITLIISYCSLKWRT